VLGALEKKRKDASERENEKKAAPATPAEKSAPAKKGDRL
jgi:hypothetical protein